MPDERSISCLETLKVRFCLRTSMKNLLCYVTLAESTWSQNRLQAFKSFLSFVRYCLGYRQTDALDSYPSLVLQEQAYLGDLPLRHCRILFIVNLITG